jgi:Ca-activated chloride channel family protein
MSFRFAYPLLMCALLALIFAWLFFEYMRKPASAVFSTTSALKRLMGSGESIKARIPLILFATALILLAIAAGRPQLYNVEHETISPGVDIILCLDTSGSMQALDFTLDNQPAMRLTAVKKVVSDFIKKREHDRMGLVVFGAEAYTQAPLTMDKGLLLQLVDGMQIGMAGDSTSIGDAIAISSKRLKDLNAPTKIIILLTDGRSNSGKLTPQQSAEAAKALGIKIYTIGVGGHGEAPFMVNSLFGQRMVYQDVDLDEDTLKEIAKTTDSRFFLASDTKGLEDIYTIIDKAEKRDVKIKEFFSYKELYRWLLIPALVLMLGALGLEMSIFGVTP